MLFRFGLICMLASLVSCASNSPNIWTDNERGYSQETSYFIDAFENKNSSTAKHRYPQAPEIVKESFEMAFRKSGSRVVGEESADIIISGIVTSYFQGGSWPGLLSDVVYTNVAFSIQGKDKKTGAVAFKASHSKTTGFHYDYDPALLSQEVAQKLVESLKQSMK